MSQSSNARAFSVAEPSAHELAALLKQPTRVVDIHGVSAGVPVSLTACFDYIFNEGIVEGIFRVSGSVRKIKQVKGDYSNLNTWLQSRESKPLPRDVSGILKRYTRDYFHAIGGLFVPSVLASLLTLYTGYALKLPPLKVRCTSFGSELPSVAETEPAPTSISEPSALLNSISELLASKNPSHKNALFIYYLHMLSILASYEETTKMTSANFSILFQQHIFETSNLSALSSYQDLLLFLIDNADDLAVKYACFHEIYGIVEESENELDSESAESAESPSSSPLTECFSHTLSATDSRRRSSISNRLSSLWESYNMPARSSKRFSLFSKSSEKLPADQPVSPHEPVPSYEEMVSRSLPTNVEQVITKSSNLDEYASFLTPCNPSPPAKLASSPSLQSILEDGPVVASSSKLLIPTDNYFENTRRSLLPSQIQNPAASQSSMLAVSDVNISPSMVAVSPLTPPSSSPILPQNVKSIDEPELSPIRSKTLEKPKPSFGRRISMKLRKRINS